MQDRDVAISSNQILKMVEDLKINFVTAPYCYINFFHCTGLNAQFLCSAGGTSPKVSGFLGQREDSSQSTSRAITYFHLIAVPE